MRILNVRQTGLIAVLVLLFALLFGGCGKDKSEESALGTVRVAYIPYSPTLPFFVALEENLFEKHGLAVEPVRLSGSSTAIQAIAAGNVDISFNNNLSASLPYLDKNPGAFKLILPSVETKDANYDYVLVRPDLYGEPVAAFAERTIGLRRGAVDKVLSDLYFQKEGGFSLEQTAYHQFESSALIQQFIAGNLDVLVTVDPDATILLSQSHARLFQRFYRGKILDPFPAAATSVSSDLLRERPNAVSAFEDAIVEALNLMVERADQYRSILPKYIPDLPPDVAAKVGLPQFVTEPASIDSQLRELMLIYQTHEITTTLLRPEEVFYQYER